MCGTSEYSVTELKDHHVVCGSTADFRKVLDWFWTAVANFTEEEKARLLQFTTGMNKILIFSNKICNKISFSILI